MANEKNLKPIRALSKEEAKKRGAAGGKASGESRRRRKALREQMRMLLELPVVDNKSFNAMAQFGVELDEIDNNTRLVYCLLKKAFTGDVAAIREVRSVIGEDQNADAIARLDEMIDALKGASHADG